MSGEAGMHQAQCVVYSKRTAKLMASVKLNQGRGDEAWSNLKEGGDVEAGKKNSRPAKTGKQRLRWNLIFNLLILILLPLPIWLPFLTEYLGVPLVSFILLPSIQGFFLLFWIVVSLQAIRTVSIMYANRDTDFREEVKKLPAKYSENRPRHVAVISCYKEPVDLIAGTIDTLASQTLASEITMVVSFEERTPDLKYKQGALCDRFGQKFHEIIFTIHPYGLEDEIPGKCSNANCGIRTALAHVKRSAATEADFDPDRIIITTCDADSKFHPRYMEALTYKYLTAKDGVTGCVYQAPLLYNWKLDELSFVTRVTGVVRAFLMMGAMIPFNINTMSIFSFSASLCIRGDFIHPGYQMDDIIALIRWMGVCRRRIQIVMVPVPVLSGPTTGRVIEEEIKEWAVQARRWTIGAGEVFHYFIVKSRGIPFFTGLFWGCLFFMYYGKAEEFHQSRKMDNSGVNEQMRFPSHA